MNRCIPLRSTHFAVGIVVSLLWVTGCTETRYARPPVIPQQADLETRQRVYARQHLVQRWGSMSSTWVRGDEEFTFGEISGLAERYPESAEKYHAAQNRTAAMATMASIGGGIVGFTLGYSLAASAANQWSGTTKALLYTGGGALILTPLIIIAATPSPEDDLAAAYNAGLRRELGLAGPKPPAPPLPRAYLEHTWRF